MAQFMFGAGMMIAIPKKPTPTPRVLGTMQEASIEFSGSTKELFGQHQFAEAVARGQQKITGKAKMASINMDVYNDTYFNEDVLQGQNLAIFNKEFAVDKTAFTVTPTLAANTVFLENLGVLDNAGKTLTRVSGTPNEGEYGLDEKPGVYTFHASLKEKPVFISYLYHDKLMGEARTFKSIFNGRFNGKQLTLILNSCTSSKLSLISTKLEDFSIPEFDFAAMADDTNRVGELSMLE